MESKATLKAGDVCLDCQHKGLEKYLRYFKINLHGDTILKCESNRCMYPYNDELSSSDEEDKSLDNVSQTNSLKLINDLIRQFDYEEDVHDTLSDVPVTESISDQVTQFDITFLDDINTACDESFCKTEIVDDKKPYFPLGEARTMKYDIRNETSNENTSSEKLQLPKLNLPNEISKNSCPAYEMAANDNNIDVKHKITIQSIETLKTESPLYHELPTSSKNSLIPSGNSASNLHTTLTAEDQQKNASKPVKTELETHKINNNSLKSQTKTLNSTDPSSVPRPNASKKTPKKSRPINIPKADILKANAVLKKFVDTTATIEENDQSPKYNRKYKSVRKRDLRETKSNIKKVYKVMPEPAPALQNTDPNYSFDKITQILLAKK